MQGWINYRERFGSVRYNRSAEAISESAYHQLSFIESQALRAAALSCPYNPYVIEQREDFIKSAQSSAAKALDVETIRSVKRILDQGLGAVCLGNLPSDPDLPDTPLEGGSLSPQCKDTFVSEFVSFVVGEIVGAEPFNFRQEGLGSSPLIDNIVPVPRLRAQKGAGGFDNNFPFHSESAWHRLRPDYLVLNGLRGDANAQTLLFSAQNLNLAEGLVRSMPRPKNFRLAAPQLYQQMEDRGMPMGTDQYSYQDPIHQGIDGNYTLNVNFNGTDCSSEDSALWLNEFEKFIEENACYLVLDADMAIILNNSRTCHTRSGYDPVFNGKQRWFQRTYFKRDLWSASNKPRPDTAIARSLISRGWLTEDLDLTKMFSDFIGDNQDLRLLECNMQQLVADAYKFGPSSGSRLV